MSDSSKVRINWSAVVAAIGLAGSTLFYSGVCVQKLNILVDGQREIDRRVSALEQWKQVLDASPSGKYQNYRDTK